MWPLSSNSKWRPILLREQLRIHLTSWRSSPSSSLHSSREILNHLSRWVDCTDRPVVWGHLISSEGQGRLSHLYHRRRDQTLVENGQEGVGFGGRPNFLGSFQSSTKSIVPSLWEPEKMESWISNRTRSPRVSMRSSIPSYRGMVFTLWAMQTWRPKFLAGLKTEGIRLPFWFSDFWSSLESTCCWKGLQEVIEIQRQWIKGQWAGFQEARLW